MDFASIAVFNASVVLSVAKAKNAEDTVVRVKTSAPKSKMVAEKAKEKYSQIGCAFSSIDWGAVGKAAVITVVGIAAAYVVVQSGGMAAPAVAAMLSSYGVSFTLTEGAVVAGSYVVGGGLVVTAVSDAAEVTTGYNLIRDGLLDGDYELYQTLREGLALAGGAYVIAGQTANGMGYGSTGAGGKSVEGSGK
jgi:hypothetical protein